jgi:regulator of sigma E protease
MPPVVGSVTPGLPAERSGLLPGDRVLKAGGDTLRSWSDLVRVMGASAGNPVPLVVQRDDERLAVEVTPEMPTREEIEAGMLAQPRIGIGALGPRARPGPIGALSYGADQTSTWISQTVKFLGQLFVGKQSPRNLGGPIMIAQVSGKVARAGAEALLGLMAILSINLAVLNLLPIPVLDGGHLVFLAVEAVRGRALSIEQRMRATQVGFFVVLAIMVWAIANDVLRLFGV